MNFYQDDNALVFKFTHINEPAGNLGTGIFGQGPYRFTLTPYLPIFYLFGYNPKAYYVLDLIFIVVSVIAIYIFFLSLFEDQLKARIAALLYSAGYIGSDSLIRIFNSVLTSLSIIFSCGAIGFYYQYFKKNNLLWYFFSLFSFFMAIYLGVIRTHYLFFVIIACEIIFFMARKFKSIKEAISLIIIGILKIVPFFYLFQKYVIAELDSRSDQGIKFLESLINGDLYNTYSFFTTLGNMILSNQIYPKIYTALQQTLNFVLIPRNIVILLFLILLIVVIYLYKNKLLSRKFSLGLIMLVTIILIISRKIFSYQGLLLNINNSVSLFTGIFFALTCSIFLKALPHKRIAILFLSWMAVNLLLYSAYLPTNPLTSDDRYITHSFIPLVGLLSIWSVDLTRKLKHKKLNFLPLVILLGWGILNLVSAVWWHTDIIRHRSDPSKRFFSQLKNYYPTFPKKSLFYFYIPDKPFAHPHYDSGFGVGQMPDETAIAWRYGVDRYDLTIVNSFSDLKKQINENKTPLEHIFTFISDPDNLINTTQKTRFLLQHGSFSEIQNTTISNTKLNLSPYDTIFEIEPMNINVNNISSLTDLKLTLKLTGEPLNPANLNFPLRDIHTNNQFSKETIASAFDYQTWQADFQKDFKITTDNNWLDHKSNLAVDGNPETYWQGDRIEWSNIKSNLILDFGQVIKITGINYRNGPSSLAPTKFEILTSANGQNFNTVTQVSRSYTDQESYRKIQRINFDPTIAQYVKLNFLETSSDDSPAISEIEIIPEKFRDLDLEQVYQFLDTPFNFVESLNQWEILMNNSGSIGKVQIFWKTDSSDKFRSDINSSFALSYDGNPHDIFVTIPSDGQYLKEIMLVSTIPGKLLLENIKYQNIPLFK